MCCVPNHGPAEIPRVPIRIPIVLLHSPAFLFTALAVPSAWNASSTPPKNSTPHAQIVSSSKAESCISFYTQETKHLLLGSTREDLEKRGRKRKKERWTEGG